MFVLKQKLFILFGVLFLLPRFSLAKPMELKSSSEKKQAISFLKKALNKYQSQSTHFKIEKQLFLPSLEETIKSRGDFYITKQKFRLKIEGDTNYLMVFNGEYLWYQSDMKEKIVFKLKNHPQIDLFFRLFDSATFFQYFSIQKILKEGRKKYQFQIKPKQEIEGLKEIFLVVGNYIQETKIVWDQLGQWQKYKFLNPWVKKKFPESKFQFSEKNFEVISREKL